MKLLILKDIDGETCYLNAAAISYIETVHEGIIGRVRNHKPPFTRINICGVGNGWGQCICMKEGIEDVVKMVEKA